MKTFKSFKELAEEKLIESAWKKDNSSYSYDLDSKTSIIIKYESDDVIVGWNDERGKYQTKAFKNVSQAKSFIKDKFKIGLDSSITLSTLKKLS
jgi:hypothetical protein